jgi:hypothetical protein
MGMKHPKSIRFFLMDGTPGGRLSVELSNWTGKAYRIPRNLLAESQGLKGIRSTGVYLLFSELDGTEEQLYVGEGEDIYARLKEHLQKKEFWYEAIAFISKDDNLNKAHVKYLENRLYDKAKQAGRYQLTNDKTPTRSMISEPDQAEMEEFLEQMILMVHSLGHRAFAEPRSDKNKGGKHPLYLLKAARGAEASGQPSDEGFTVFKGSKASKDVVPSYPASLSALRQRLLQQGKLEEVATGYVFNTDLTFRSPSTAAMIVMGRSANGLAEWKQENGKSLKEAETEGVG